jgi:hypothetical protein
MCQARGSNISSTGSLLADTLLCGAVLATTGCTTNSLLIVLEVEVEQKVTKVIKSACRLLSMHYACYDLLNAKCYIRHISALNYM